ncbi:MAG: pyruvate formate lyase family protein [Clostridiales bacterium]|nr:pyruvate formate lyase family protein [Clostridiales bacterium]
MNTRISELTKLTLEGKMYANPVAVEFDREDLFLSKQQRESKRLCEFILNQEPVLTEHSKMTGFFNCDGSVVGDAFRRMGHEATQKVMSDFYLKNIDNLSTMEWQHATADYKKVLEKGISGIIEEIDGSLKTHSEQKQVEFLNALKKVANTLIKWAEKCSYKALELSKTVNNVEHKKNLELLSKALLNVPKNKPSSFYEAVLTIYICFSADPDSVGTLDRYLTPFYENDIKNGILTRDEAKEYLQELFLMLQAATKVTSVCFTRGGESHFCIGGYLPNGEDGFNELSELILESLTELPTWIPQVTLRWTNKTPKEVFRLVLDYERKDPHKRIAFQNDEKRMKCYTEICGFPFEKSVGYTTVGCNEPAFLGAITGSNSKINFARSMETVFHKKSDEIVNVKTFEEFYNIFFGELKSDLETAYEYDNKYNRERAKDINYLSSIFFNGCIEKAKSLTQGAGDVVIASPMCIGITNVIDSLIVVKQFVFDEKMLTMKELIDAIQANWQGYEELRALILKKGDFFGNDTDRSNYVAQKLYQSLYEFLDGKKNLFGYQWLIGDLLGYNEHHKWFGEKTKATPDGRFDGDMLKFGIGQSEGRDKNGLTALLNSIANLDPNGISCGSTVTNISIDEQLIKNDDNFEKTVDMLETYFKNGGIHFQLTYVSKEDLINAKETPENYGNLRVRVTGFSDYFVKLKESIQDDIIERTTHKC